MPSRKEQSDRFRAADLIQQFDDKLSTYLPFPTGMELLIIKLLSSLIAIMLINTSFHINLFSGCKDIKIFDIIAAR
jgi:hypothetical protein